MSDCGLFEGEVFADEDGTYLGDFSYGDGPGGPFGWVTCMNFCEGTSGFFSAFNVFAPPTPCVCGQSPRLPVFDTFGAGHAYTVSDPTGPAGLEAIPAMRIDLPGSPQAFIGWAGHQVVDDTTGDWETGLLGGDIGWKPVAGETWVFSCWARVVEDANGVLLADANLHFDRAPVGFSAVEPASFDELTLTSDYQFFTTTVDGSDFALPVADWWYPLIGFGGSIEHTEHWTFPWGGHLYDRVGYAPYGSVLIKCAHLYPTVPTGGNWIDSFHGHG